MDKKIIILSVSIATVLSGMAFGVAAAASKNKQLTKVPGFSPVYSPNQKYIVYVESRDDGTEGRLFRRKASSNSKSKGTAITDDYASSPTYSPDGNYIIYSNLSNNSYLYKKNAGDDNDGDKFVKTSSLDPTYSPDGKYIVYVNSDDEGRLYRKEVADTDDEEEGDTINDANAHNPVYSTDGEHIYYLGIDDSKLYKKDADDDDDGDEVSGIKAYSFTISPSGKYIVYSNVNDNGKLYYRKLSGSGKGKKINNYTSNEPSYFHAGEKVIYSNGDNKLFLYSAKVN